MSLRYTKEIVAQRAVRNSRFDVESQKPVRVAVLHVTESRQNERIQRYKWTIKVIESAEAVRLFQDEPRNECRYEKHTRRRRYSFTDSRESRQNCAWKELMILRQKGRIPTMELRLNIFIQFQMKRMIDELRENIRRCLKYHRIDAVTSIELTRGKDGKPNNTVHLHYLIGNEENDGNLRDDEKEARRKEITGFIVKVCKRLGLALKRDFKIEHQQLWDGEKYFAYFVKYGKHGKNIPLFLEGLRMQEFTQTGWFEKGEKKRLWDEFLKEKYGEKYARKTSTTESNNDDTCGAS